MASDRFRHELRREASQWLAEELILPEQWERLSDRYQLATLDRHSSQRFTAILLALGGLLVGLGAITFVAANWQVWSREVKVVLLAGALVAANTTGFYLWRGGILPPGTPQSSFRHPRLGQALLLLGALLLGANIGLLSQMFHQSGSPAGLYWIWSLGVLAMAVGLRLTLLATVAWILAVIAWMYGQGGLASGWPGQLSQHGPLIASLVFVPLAYWCRSRRLFGLVAISLVVALMVNVGEARLAAGPSVVLGLLLPFGLLWGWRDRPWHSLSRRWAARWGTGDSGSSSQSMINFEPVARLITLVWLGGTLYWLSFHWPWEYGGAGTRQAFVPDPQLGPAIDVFVLLMVTALLWLYRLREVAYRQRAADLLTLTLLGIVLTLAATSYVHVAIVALPICATFLTNALLFLLAAGLIRDGLQGGDRAAFWGGLLLLGLQVMSRVLEYDTGLVTKAIGLTLCGCAVLAAGLWFERQR